MPAMFETQNFFMDISHYFIISMSPRFYLFFYYPKIRPKAPIFPLPGMSTFIGENTASTRVGSRIVKSLKRGIPLAA